VKGFGLRNGLEVGGRQNDQGEVHRRGAFDRPRHTDLPGMMGGRGWIAVALVVFAGWRPWPSFFAAILFGCIEAIIPYINAAGIRVPQYLMLMTPYAATLAVMMWVGVTQRARQ
jgi:ABC-type uncharacterized transport system permease subunit